MQRNQQVLGSHVCFKDNCPVPPPSLSTLSQRVSGVKRSLEFDSDEISGADKRRSLLLDSSVNGLVDEAEQKKVSKKNDCICTCCAGTGLPRYKCLVFKESKYNLLNPTVREKLAQRYRESKGKELICRKCDVELLSYTTHSNLCNVQQSTSDSLAQISAVAQSVTPKLQTTSHPANTQFSDVPLSLLYICTCCRLREKDRRKYLVFRSSRYNMSSPPVKEALEYQYSTHTNKELICRSCDARLLKDKMPLNAVSSPTKARPLPNTKCIACDTFRDKKMKIFDRPKYGNNPVLDNILSECQTTDASVICFNCDNKYVRCSLVTCAQCSSTVLRKGSVQYNSKRFPQHSKMLFASTSNPVEKARLCILCHKSALNEKPECIICKRNVALHHTRIFDETSYDFSQFIVAQVINDSCHGITDESTICNKCHTSLVNSSDESPVIPRNLMTTKLRCASSFLHCLAEMPSFVCTCCHRLLFRKTVRPFLLSDYNQENAVVQACLSHRVSLRMEKVGDLSRLFSAEKNMLIPGSTYNLFIGDDTVPEYICVRCKSCLTKKKPEMPDQACANGLRLYDIPDELRNMFPLERRVISFRIPFITVIVVRRYGGHYKVNGPPVNVPATLDQIVKILPRMPSQLQLHPLKLKRKLEYKSHYMYDKVRKDKVISAILWLKQNNGHYANVAIDTHWLEQSSLNDIALFVDDDTTGFVKCCDQSGEQNSPDQQQSATPPSDGVPSHSVSDAGYVGVCGHSANMITGHPYTGRTENSGECDMSEKNMVNSNVCGSGDKNLKEYMTCEGDIDAKSVSGDAGLIDDQAALAGEICTESVSDDAELIEDQAAIDRRQDTTGDPLPSVVQFDSLENVIYNCAPGENNIPRYILLDDDFEVLAFPDLFPYGFGGYNSRTSHCRLPIRKYFQQRLMNVDGRFAKNLEYIFCAQYISDIQQIQSDANLAVRLSRGRTLNGQTITAGVLQDPVALQQLIRTEQAYKFLKNVRGSPSYWQGELYDVLAMLKSLGIPTWFLTLSAADLHWPEMIQAIASQYGLQVSRQMINDMSAADKSFFLRQNPVTGVRMFQHRVESFFAKYLLSPANPIGHVSEYVIKIEFQMRGSPHAHCLVWIKDAPKLDKEDDATVCSFIDKYISAALPPDTFWLKRSRDQMMSLQRHSHSDYCRRNKKCRFGFPKAPSSETVICRKPDGESSTELIDKAKIILGRVHDELRNNEAYYASCSLDTLLSASGVSHDEYQESLKVTSKGPSVILRRAPCDININSCNTEILGLWGANVDLQYVINEVATVMYVCSYMTKGEKAMGETLKRVARECMHEDMRTQMNKIKREFLGKRVIGAPESCMRVLSSWLMKKSRKVIYVNSNMKNERVSLPKTKAQLAKMDKDDDNVFATSLIDRYCARPYNLDKCCLAEFAVNYDVVSQKRNVIHSEGGKVIKLRNELGYMQKRKIPSILRTRRFKIATEPERYYHAKLILYYPWFNEDSLVNGFQSYQLSYEAKKDIVLVNAQLFNDDCDAFDVNIDDVSESNVTDSMWDLVAPSVAEDDSVTQKIGFTTLQENKESEDSSPGTSTHSNTLPSSSLSKLYFQAASRQGMRFRTYCEHINSLNAKQKEVVMFNRQWCKDYVHKHRLGKKKDGYRVFLSGCGGTGKSHVVRLIQRDMSYLLQHVLHPEPDQPIALVTAPTGSAAYNIGGSTIHSALCINDRSKGTMSYERKCMMQMKLEHLMLLITDEISMVGFDFFQRMNEVITSIKGLTGCNWGGICVLTVGDLYQLPPVASTPVYAAPRTANSLNDLAPNGWEEFMLHELTEVMRQKDMVFANALNNIRVKQPELFSPEDDMLRGREVHLSRDHESYPHNAMHVYAQNVYCDEWNEFMLERLPGDIVTSIATDSRKDTSTNLANVAFSDKPRETGNLRHTLRIKVGAKVMLTTNVDVSDGLTNGSMGVVSKIICDNSTAKIKTVLVRFNDDSVGINARNASTYKAVDSQAVPIYKGQATFTINNRRSCNASRSQFPLTLAWAVTIHKCQGLTLPEVVVDMSPDKGKFSPGQAYVAFSRVRTLDKLHIINYTRSQIRLSSSAEGEMVRLRRNSLMYNAPSIPSADDTAIALVHINICSVLQKLPFLSVEKVIQSADIISMNETHLEHCAKFQPAMLGLNGDYCIFRCDRDGHGGGVAIIAKSNVQPEKISIGRGIEMVAVRVSYPKPAAIVSVYRPPVMPAAHFMKKLTEVLQRIQFSDVCVVGDFNEDILLCDEKQCCAGLKSLGFTQWIRKPTRDSGTLIDHLYTTCNITALCDVFDCYYSDHDFVASSLNIQSTE